MYSEEYIFIVPCKVETTDFQAVDFRFAIFHRPRARRRDHQRDRHNSEGIGTIRSNEALPCLQTSNEQMTGTWQPSTFTGLRLRAHSRVFDYIDIAAACIRPHRSGRGKFDRLSVKPNRGKRTRDKCLEELFLQLVSATPISDIFFGRTVFSLIDILNSA